MSPKNINYKFAKLEDGVLPIKHDITPVHSKRTVRPQNYASSIAWIEDEDKKKYEAYNGQERPLLHGDTNLQNNYHNTLSSKIKSKYYKWKKRIEKILKQLKPPYYILFITSVTVSFS